MVILGTMVVSSSSALDWPAFHGNAQRSGYTSEAVTGELKLTWSLKMPHAPTPAWSRNGRIRYDDVFQPVVADGTVYFGDHAEGLLRAIDLKTGREKWTFQTNGPIRCAPAVWKNSVVIGSDDGFIYSLKTDDGSLRWSIRPGPSDELVLGNEYMISKWPVRGAPTVEGNTIYAGAGIWPSDGFYLLAIDADTGKVKWCNDDSGSLSIRQPHGAISKSGAAAQGYIALSKNNILVPPGRSLPAIFDKKTGTFRSLNPHGKIGGGVSMTHGDTYTCAGVLWSIKNSRQVQSYLPMTRISEWPLIEALPHDAMTPTGIVAARGAQVQSFKWTTKNNKSLDDEWSVKASGTVSELIIADGQVILGLDGAIEIIDRRTQEKKTIADNLDGDVGGLAYADGHLIASTTTGQIYAFAIGGQGDKASVISNKLTRPKPGAKTIKYAKAILKATGADKGYALDLGCGDGSLSIALTQLSDLNVIAVEPDKTTFINTRKRLRNAGLYGTRVMIFNRPLKATGLPNMVANLIVSNKAKLRGSVLAEAQRTQRPYGGVICKRKANKLSIKRRAGIKGAGSWTHQYANPANTLSSGDTAVSDQLSMLWYRDYKLPSASRWWRPPAPLADNGILYHSCPNGLIAVDAYNGTEIWRHESKDLLSTQAGLYVLRTGGVFCLGDNVVYLRKKAQCLCLDAKTGELLQTISLPDEKAHDYWGYLAYSDGVVYGTAADTSHSTTNPYPYNKNDSINEGKTFFAAEAKSGRILWQYEPKNHIGNTAVAIDDRNVYVIDRTSIWLRTRKEERQKRRGSNPKPIVSGRLTALNKKTGKVNWTNDTHVFGSAPLVSGPARRVCVWHEDKMTSFDADGGKYLYSLQSPYKVNVYNNKPPVIIGDTIYWASSAFDLLSGKKLAFDFLRSYGCGSISASASMLFFRSGTIGYVDLNAPRANKNKITTDDIQNFGGIRPGCYINIVPACGIVLVPDTSSSCSCSYFNQCWIALQPAQATGPNKRSVSN